MKTSITNIKFFVLKGPQEKRPHWVSNFIVPNANELLVILKTNEGVEGFGLATSYTDISPIVHVIQSGIPERILGSNPLEPERLYQSLFDLTASRLAHEKGWSREALIRISAAVDIA